MSKIEFSKEETKVITAKIQAYLLDEFDQEIGQLGTEMLLDFFSKEIGSYFYNRGLYDAQAILTSKMDTITEAI